MTEGKVIALGFFDGVHLGHRVLLETAVEIGKQVSLPVFALTFCGLEIFKNVQLINTCEDRRRLILTHSGIADVIPMDFTASLRELTSSDFIGLLSCKYHVRHIVVGENFSFGRDRAGIQQLFLLAQERNIQVTVVPLSMIDGHAVSSSRIREALINGNMESANGLLGHPHILSGIVVHGRHLGHTLGFPTLNVLYPEALISIPQGVYVTKTRIPGGQLIPSLTNFGIHPTFESAGVPLTETHLFRDVDALYGKEVQIEFLSFLRKEKKFESVSELCEQLKKDKKAGMAYCCNQVR